MSGWTGHIETFEHQAGPGQVVVLYVPENTGVQIDPGVLYGRVAEDAAARAAEGWRIVSTDTVPMRQMGTTGNVLFQSGGQFATQVAVAVVYRQEP